VETVQEARRIPYDAPDARRGVSDALYEVLAPLYDPAREVVCLCIGTDRSTGDALGPLVGRALRQSAGGRMRVVGCLEDPVHASNLHDAVSRVAQSMPDAIVVAIDACLGRLETVGTITVGAGPLCPGAGVNKALPQVGAAFVTGTVNVGGFMEYFVLQNTRLSLVVSMAEVIAAGVAHAIQRLLGDGEAVGSVRGLMLPEALVV
jgi:putative sporulation protein YyaC